MNFSVGFYIMGPNMPESTCFWSATGAVKVCQFYYGKAYISELIL